VVNSELKEPARKFELFNNSSYPRIIQFILGNSRVRKNVLSIDHFELKKFELTTFDCILFTVGMHFEKNYLTKYTKILNSCFLETYEMTIVLA